MKEGAKAAAAVWGRGHHACRRRRRLAGSSPPCLPGSRGGRRNIWVGAHTHPCGAGPRSILVPLHLECLKGLFFHPPYWKLSLPLPRHRVENSPSRAAMPKDEHKTVFKGNATLVHDASKVEIPQLLSPWKRISRHLRHYGPPSLGRLCPGAAPPRRGVTMEKFSPGSNGFN